MPRALVNGVELEYEVAGSGEPVLLISPMVADGFLPLVSEPALAHGYQLVTYHRRGWAGSTHTPPPVRIADHAADAAALLDHLGVGRAHVAGHSSGAAVALQLALERPEIVHTLVLLEPSLLSGPGAAELMQKAAPAFEAYAAGRHETAVSVFLAAVSGLEWKACRAALDQRVPGAVPQTVKDADTFFGVELPALRAWTFGAEQAAAIVQPVLSVRGTDTEPLWIDVADQLRVWLRQVEDCTIEGAGHLLQMQRPQPVAESVAAFFGRHPLMSDRSKKTHRAATAALAVSLLAALGCQASPAPTAPGTTAPPVSASVVDGGVDVCHRTSGDSPFILITVDDHAVPGHFEHGDARPGDPVPEQPGNVFDAECQVTPVLACPCWADQTEAQLVAILNSELALQADCATFGGDVHARGVNGNPTEIAAIQTDMSCSLRTSTANVSMTSLPEGAFGICLTQARRIVPQLGACND